MRRRAGQQQGPDHLDLWRQIIGSIEGSYYETPRLTATGTGSSGSVGPMEHGPLGGVMNTCIMFFTLQMWCYEL